MMPILFIILLLPLVGAVAAALGGKHSNKIAIVFAFAVLLFALVAVHYFIAAGNIANSYMYIKSLGIGFNLALNYISVFMIMIVSILFFAASLANLFFVKEEASSYNALFMLTELSTLGVFLSANLFLLYLFWDAAIIFLFFMIFHFGGYDRRYAAVKFLIYSIVSSGLLLVGILLIYAYVPGHTFDISAIEAGAAAIPSVVQVAIAALLAIAFMIKIPIFPFHSWAPDAYTEAPPTGSAILAGVLSKFGAYGMLLLFMMLPVAREYAIYIAEIAVFSMFYAAIAAITQREMKRMLAYLSIAEMGFITFGISAFNSLAIAGALFGMLSHALVIAALMLLAFTIDKSFGTTVISRLRGLANSLPKVSYAMLFGIFAAVGLPLTTGFVMDVLIVFGAIKAFSLLGVLPLAAVLINGAYLLWLFERSFGSSHAEPRVLEFPETGVYAAVATLFAFVVMFGVLPYLLLGVFGI